MPGFTPDTSNTSMVVAITQVDFVNRVWTGYNRLSGEVPIYPAVMPGGNYVVPKVGEQWIVQKYGTGWFLDDKLDFQDSRAALPLEEGMTAFGTDTGPTYLLGKRVEIVGDLSVNGVKYVQGGATAPTAQTQYWDQEMVLNAGALASGYNDLAGGIIVNAPNGILLDAILFRLGGDPAATIGGSGGISVSYWRGTTTSAEVASLGGVTGLTSHDNTLTITNPVSIAHNSVLRAKIALGSATVAVSCHVQWRGRRL